MNRRYVPLLFLFLSTVVSLSLAEVVIRILDADRIVEEILVNSPEFVDNGSRMRVSDPDIGWFLTGYEYEKDRLTIQSSPPQTYLSVKSPNTFRILVLGDSIAEVWVCKDPLDKFPAMFERDLNQTEGSRHYEIMNVSVGGYNTTQRVAILRKWFSEWEFDLIVVQHALNDDVGPYIYQKTLYRDSFYVRYSLEIWGLPFFKDSWLLNSALIRFINVRLHDAQLLNNTVLLGYYSNEQRENYEWLKTWCDTKGIPLFVLIFPFLCDYSNNWYVAKNERINSLLSELNIPHYDLYGDYRDIPLEELRASPDDIWHPGKRGHEIAAAKLHEQLSTRSLLE